MRTSTRKNIDTATGLIFGKSINITNVTSAAGDFEISYTTPTQGVGFYTSSGGLQANQVLSDKTYINPSKPNGSYSGSAVVQYYVPVLQKWENGPTVVYHITLEN